MRITICIPNRVNVTKDDKDYVVFFYTKKSELTCEISTNCDYDIIYKLKQM